MYKDIKGLRTSGTVGKKGKRRKKREKEEREGEEKRKPSVLTLCCREEPQESSSVLHLFKVIS